MPPSVPSATAAALRSRLRAALPAPGVALAGSALWAANMGASALLWLLRADWQTGANMREVVLLFALGGLLAFAPGLWLARLASGDRTRRDTAFATGFVFLAAATVGITAGLYGLLYRQYYAEWHAPAFTVVWAIQFAFTVGGALYQFAVLGVRMYFPLGFAALVLAALWFSRTQSRRIAR